MTTCPQSLLAQAHELLAEGGQVIANANNGKYHIGKQSGLLVVAAEAASFLP